MLVSEIARWIYWYPWRVLVQLLPISISYRLANSAGYGMYLFARGRRARTYQGLKITFPDATARELHRMVRRTFQNYALNSIEVFYYPKLNPVKINTMVQYQGLDILDSALQQHRGVILAHGHFGNEEFLMPALGYAGYKLHQIGSRWQPPIVTDTGFGKLVNSIRNKAFEKRIGYREQLPVTFHYIDKTLRSAVRVLQQNEVVLFAVDGRESEQWLELEFLGRKAWFSPGLARFAKLTHAVVLPVFLLREPKYQHRLIIGKPIEIENKDDESIVKEFIAILESYVRRYPEHYAKVYWLHSPFFV
ncbi:MAG: lysophospholipid acyltransferase family protein [bacterium]